MDLIEKTTQELRVLLLNIKNEISRRESGTSPVSFQIKFSHYNANRYGQPWAAFVTDWQPGERPSLEFTGVYNGKKGEAGILEGVALPGTLIKYGQKDYRGKNTKNEFAFVNEYGAVIDLEPQRAREYFDERNV